MIEKVSEILKSQLQRIGTPDFDLDKWKELTIACLIQSLGKSNYLVKKIEKFEFPHNGGIFNFTTLNSDGSSNSIDVNDSNDDRWKELKQLMKEAVTEVEKLEINGK